MSPQPVSFGIGRLTISVEGLASMNKKVLVFLVICAMWAMACGSNPGGNTLGAPSLSPEALQEVGAFEAVDPGLAEIDAKSALERARAADFGREGNPEVSLVHSVGENVGGVAKGQLVWIFHWSGLNEVVSKGFPPNSNGKPLETTFVYSDYWVFVDAATGTPISDALH